MASGDIKCENPVIEKVTSGAAIAIGELCHLEADDGKWDPTADGDIGKFGVALSAASGADESVYMLLEGEVEVKATAAAIPKGAYVLADAKIVKTAGALAETAVLGTIVGYAKTAFESGGQGVIKLLG